MYYQVVDISPYKLIEQINLSIKLFSIMEIKDNIIFTKPNLLMIEWLLHNNIIFKNNLYLQYMINPFYKTDQNNLMVGLINIDNHPNCVRNILKSYIDNIYGVTKYMELFTVLIVNVSNSSNIYKHKMINKLIICDSNENELYLDWLSK